LDRRDRHRQARAVVELEELQAQRHQHRREDNGSNRVMIAGRCSSFH
jgi:hypothetical protein